jgi:F-type H+-transporting ATPase subunit epsilon
MNDFQVDIVSAESEVYSGLCRKLFVTGIDGELEIRHNHTPLLTMLAPGQIWLTDNKGEENGFVILGGMLEVQPKITVVLADSVIRAEDIDLEAAKKAKLEAEKAIQESQNKSLSYEEAHNKIAATLAQIRILNKLRKLKK